MQFKNENNKCSHIDGIGGHADHHHWLSEDRD